MSVGARIETLQTPAFVVDRAVVRNNCRKMLDLAKAMGISLRGQTKTHKTVEAGILQTGGTKKGLVTSTFVESEMFADAGFDDILYGYPLIEAHVERNLSLMRKLEQYHVMITNLQAVDIMAKNSPPEGKKWSVFLKIDCGNNRAGVFWSDGQSVDIAKAIEEHKDTMLFQGLYVHCGDSYKATSTEAVKKVRDESIRMLLDVSSRLAAAGIAVNNVGIGSTPSCSHEGQAFSKLTEIHPGNYVFYDAQQMMLGSCAEADIAGRVLTRVIGHYPHRNQMLIDCGFAALTKQGFNELQGSYAVVQNHPELKVSNMTQEIGYAEPRTDAPLDFAKFPLGSLLFLLPYHSCATAACYPKYVVHEKGIIVDEWLPCRGW